MAATVAAQGGNTFQTNMFSTVNTALEVAVMRLRQRAGQPIGEIAVRMPRQMAEQIAAQIAGDADEREAGDPAGEPPEKIIGGDQRAEQAKGDPDAGIALATAIARRPGYFTPYCVLTEQATAASTAARMAAWAIGRCRT